MGLLKLVRRVLAAPRILLLRLIDRLTVRPVPLALDDGSTTLIADCRNHRVIEVDGAGGIVWQYGTTGVAGRGANELNLPRDAKRLADGGTLIADSGNGRVIEVTTQRSVAWTYDDLRAPRSAARLANGNTLISDFDEHRVIEVTSIGAIVWSHGSRGVAATSASQPGLLARPRHAERIASGNTLISDHFNRVIEVTPAGAIAGQISTSAYVNSAERLPSGNTLLALDGSFFSFGVLEFTQAGDIPWWYMSRETSDAKRLSNGNTLIALPSTSQVIEVDTNHNIVWQYGVENAPGTGANQLHDPWEATRLTPSGARPDLMVISADGTRVGAGIFGSDASAQSLPVQELPPGSEGTFVFRVTNAGTSADAFRVTAATTEVPDFGGAAGVGWSVRFADQAGAAVDLIAGWTSAEIAPGAFVELKAFVKNLTRGTGEHLYLAVTARTLTEPAAIDAARAVARATWIL